MCTLHEGDDFGKLALVTDSPRAASIVLREDNCHFLRVDKEDFNRILRVGRLINSPLITPHPCFVRHPSAATVSLVLHSLFFVALLWRKGCITLEGGCTDRVSLARFFPQGRGSKHGAFERARTGCAGAGEESSAVHTGEHQVGVLQMHVIFLLLPLPTSFQWTTNWGQTLLDAGGGKARKLKCSRKIKFLKQKSKKKSLYIVNCCGPIPSVCSVVFPHSDHWRPLGSRVFPGFSFVMYMQSPRISSGEII